MRYLWFVVITAATLACSFAAGEKQTDFSGNWVLNPDRSDIDLSEPRGLPKINMSIGPVTVEPQDENKNRNVPPAPPEERMKGLSLHIEQSGGVLRILRTFALDGVKNSVTQTFMLDGSQNINPGSDGQGEFVSRSSWEKNALVHSGIKTIRTPEGTLEIYVKEEYALSKKGARLTLSIRGISPQGVVRIKQVFLRQERGPESKAAP